MFERVRDSLAGLREGWRRERAIRAHVLFSVFGLAAFWFFEPPTEWVLAFAVLLVVGFATELINGAVEAFLDRLHPQRHPAIGAAKDMTSAASFVINVCAVLVLLFGVRAGWNAGVP